MDARIVKARNELVDRGHDLDHRHRWWAIELGLRQRNGHLRVAWRGILITASNTLPLLNTLATPKPLGVNASPLFDERVLSRIIQFGRSQIDGRRIESAHDQDLSVGQWCRRTKVALSR